MSIIQYILPIDSGSLGEILKNPGSIHDIIEEKKNQEEVWCLCKAYQGITYIATNKWKDESEELTFLLTGEPNYSGYIGSYEDGGECEVDVGYGPAWFTQNPFIKKVYAQISKISESDIRERFDGEAMDDEGIYPGVWSRGEEELQYLIEYFNIYKKCLKEAVDSNLDIILWQS